MAKGDLKCLIGIDVSPPLNEPRNGQRTIINPDTNGNHKLIVYLADHNYKDFDVSKGLAQHDHLMTAGDKILNLVGFIEPSKFKIIDEEEV